MTEQEFQYQELHAENPLDKKENQKLLSTYLQCTDGLIGKLDGTIPLTKQTIYSYNPNENITEETKDLPPPQTVLYLDKSGRPISWLVNELWEQLARQPGTKFEDNQIPQAPSTKFINIDKEDWLRMMGVPKQHIQDATEQELDFSKINPQKITRIRALFSTYPITENNLEEAWKHPTSLDGQHVMILDEVKSSGMTLEIAKRLLAMAIPEATFSGQYWATPPRKALNNGMPVDGNIQYSIEWVPVWYDAQTALGRGIGDREPYWPEIIESQGKEATRLSRIGRNILSTPPHNPNSSKLEPDKKSIRIRQDFHTMAQSLKEGKLLYIPSSDRPSTTDEEFEQIVSRIYHLNHGLSFEEWKKKRDALYSN